MNLFLAPCGSWWDEKRETEGILREWDFRLLMMRNLLWIMQTIFWMLNLWNLSKLSWIQKKIQVFMNGFMIIILFLIQSKWRWYFFASSSTFPFPFELNLHSADEVDIQTFLWKTDLFTGDYSKQGTCPIATSFENVRFSSLYANGPIKFKAQLIIYNHLNLPYLSGSSPQVYKCYWSLSIFYLHKTLWLDNLFPSAPV